jgi:glycosyltransferase involved in cell wall biosynthesis
MSILIKAYNNYTRKGGHWLLKIVGTGPQEEKLRELVKKCRLSDKVYFMGWLNYNELPQVYWNASAFVLASLSDSWGLSINEAMAAGLPLLISSNCGCVPDLCKNGINGYIFNPNDYITLSNLMLRYSNNTLDLKQMGVYSQAIIKAYSIDTWCNSLKEMVTSLES